MLTRIARRRLVALAAAGMLLVSLSLTPGHGTTGSASDRTSGQRACGGLALAADADHADGPALNRLRAQALASREVLLLRRFLNGSGYVAMDALDGATVSSRDSVVLLPMVERGNRRRGAAIAYAVHADGTRTVEAATLVMRGPAVKAERGYTFDGARVVRTDSFISCMVACLAVRCTAISRCPTIFGPGAFPACATAVCGSRSRLRAPLQVALVRTT